MRENVKGGLLSSPVGASFHKRLILKKTRERCACVCVRASGCVSEGLGEGVWLLECVGHHT